MAYDLNQVVRFSLPITDPFDGDAAVDPTGLTFEYKPPSVSATTLTYGTDAALIKDSVGNYHADVTLNAAGTWYWRWTGTGTNAGAATGSVYVNTADW